MDIAKAASQLEAAAREFVSSGGRNKAAVLEAIFQLNNETGKLLRTVSDPALAKLQLGINEVTKAAKLGDAERVASAMRKVRADLVRLQPKRQSRPATS